ncbi:ribonuclease Z [Chitinophaga horti]|uniref:Ribonuclease Z n=1 Tax=Chitinophaga horti TaxID=2920382 RepID=A0ABY6IWR1_9BACT|nr:ribonuclease Z [Chitinophaga horti]UYQ91678.1 ribonuclease Z [Chitinophaga horti]
MFAVTILGNNSALPTPERHPTAQVVTCNDQLVLIDCGEGTQVQLAKFKVRRSRIKHIVISHLHGDHYFGLIGLLNTLSMLGRTEPLFLYAPPELEAIIRLQMECAGTVLNYPFTFTPLLPDQTGVIIREKEFEVSFFPTRHRIPCYGFAFNMQRRKRKILPDQAVAYEIPATFYSRLQDGEDYRRKDGTLVQNDWVTLPPAPGKRYVYCADTVYNEEMVPQLKDADLIYHETTYLHDQLQKATERFHSTSVQAAGLARLANVKRLLVGHFSSKYTDLQPFLDECRPIFPNTDLAEEGVSYII